MRQTGHFRLDIKPHQVLVTSGLGHIWLQPVTCKSSINRLFLPPKTAGSIIHVVNHSLSSCRLWNTYLNEGGYLRKDFRALFISLPLHKKLVLFVKRGGFGKKKNINKRQLYENAKIQCQAKQHMVMKCWSAAQMTFCPLAYEMEGTWLSITNACTHRPRGLAFSSFSPCKMGKSRTPEQQRWGFAKM